MSLEVFASALRAMRSKSRPPTIYAGGRPKHWINRNSENGSKYLTLLKGLQSVRVEKSTLRAMGCDFIYLTRQGAALPQTTVLRDDGHDERADGMQLLPRHHVRSTVYVGGLRVLNFNTQSSARKTPNAQAWLPACKSTHNCCSNGTIPGFGTTADCTLSLA